uniref:ATPase H+ transporting V1 subunit H n=1 Tax=Oncorhynchus mykiss TaxID=8022 RepID=A0A8C7P187_ONCMY
MDIRGAVDAAVPTNIIAAKAAEVRANKVNWQSYLQGQMISAEDCEFIKKFEVAHSEEKQTILTNEGHQCARTFLNLMAHISKEQTVQYILTLIDDTLVVGSFCSVIHWLKGGQNMQTNTS